MAARYANPTFLESKCHMSCSRSGIATSAAEKAKLRIRDVRNAEWYVGKLRTSK